MSFRSDASFLSRKGSAGPSGPGVIQFDTVAELIAASLVPGFAVRNTSTMTVKQPETGNGLPAEAQ